MSRTLGVGLILIALQPLRSATPSVELPDLVTLLRNEWKADSAIKRVRRVYASDRFFTFPKFAETAQYLESSMREMGLEHVERVNAVADGKTQVGFWTLPLAWDAGSATLELLDRRVPPAQRVVADYRNVPTSLGMWSGSTPQGGIEAEIVAITRNNIGKLDLRGKLALTDVNSSGLKSFLVKAGALGAVNAFTENPDLSGGRQWINAWGDNGWAYTKQSTPLLSFSITPTQARLIRSLLLKGPVYARAKVDTRYYTGFYSYVTGLIPGTSNEEVLTLGHTSEQGAQDNATGVSATLEALATLQRLIASGKLAKPKRGIRVLSMPEMYGSMHYVEHNRDRIKRTVAAICVDTPAASYDLPGTEYTFYMNPHVSADFTDAFILKVAATHLTSVQRPWHEKRFTTGTDTYLAEPMVGVPTVWGYSGSGIETHHNSEDTPDRVDTRSLRDISVITAAYLYYIANAGEPEALYLAKLSEDRSYSLLRGLSAEQIDYAVDRAAHAVRSVLRVVPPVNRAHTTIALTDTTERIRKFGEQQKAALPNTRLEQTNLDAAKIVVQRRRFGTIPLDDLPQDKWEGYPSGAWALVPTIALYWCDGHRTLAEVIRLTQLELGPSQFDFVGYFRFLMHHGYVDFVNGSQ